ncbi:hypothetical protein ILYODFUR_036676 [Ilyodon furcidens]|uniref:Secreted protein n=1 Tax=Ilyodon furcidens TaxID=33524 RepID=A0ABV0UYG1_9TELE
MLVLSERIFCLLALRGGHTDVVQSRTAARCTTRLARAHHHGNTHSGGIAGVPWQYRQQGVREGGRGRRAGVAMVMGRERDAPVSSCCHGHAQSILWRAIKERME